ncbi:MAG: hypothetical protein JST46_06040 [Bacteroidetes bacterium]|nr:hypothetical protein [Bacteroidota bacterium]
MKRNKIFYSVLLTVLMLGSCKQEVIQLQAPETPAPGPTPNPGTASFTKFIAIGNSYVAGVQAGALFTDGQNNSLPAIINKQLAQAGGNATFTQPTIGASLGYNLFITPNPGSDNKVIGRLLLQYGTSTDCATGKASPKPTPQKYPLGNLEAVPNPALNPSFLYTGGKTNLNNFGVPAIVLGQALISNTGNWALAGTDPRFNPFYGRLSYPGTGSTIIGDAAAAGSSFFMFYLGLDDFFLYAAFGGDPTKAPLTPATGAGALGFDQQYAGAIGALMGSNANLKGVVGNFPDIFVMPHFTAVSYNPIPLDAATASAVSAGFAGYNAALDGLIGNAGLFGISDALKAELATRKVTYTAGCTNKILIIDETLTNIAPYFDAMKANGLITQAQRDALSPYVQVRQTTSTDIIPLSTGSILGTLVGSDPTKVNGVTVPLGDQYCLIPTEIAAIRDARTAYNNIIANVASSYSTRLAVADVSAGMAALVAAQAGVYNNVTITPNINPPTGIYSEDGVHPNSRGYAFIANIFIGAINSKFGATVPLADLSKYSATALPIP